MKISGEVIADLGDVLKTLFLPLWGRAMETRRDKPLLQDPAALDVIAKVDFDFATITQNARSISSMGLISDLLKIQYMIHLGLGKVA